MARNGLYTNAVSVGLMLIAVNFLTACSTFAETSVGPSGSVGQASVPASPLENQPVAGASPSASQVESLPAAPGGMPGRTSIAREWEELLPNEAELQATFGPSMTVGGARFVVEGDYPRSMLFHERVSQWEVNTPDCQMAAESYNANRELNSTARGVVTVEQTTAVVDQYADESRQDVLFELGKNYRSACHSDFAPDESTQGWKSVALLPASGGMPATPSYAVLTQVGNCNIAVDSIKSFEHTKLLTELVINKCK